MRATDDFDVEARDGQLILTPVRAKLAELALTAEDMAQAVAWAREPALASDAVNEPAAAYEAPATKPKKATTHKARPKS